MARKRAWASANGTSSNGAAMGVRPRAPPRKTTDHFQWNARPRAFQYFDSIIEEEQREELKNKLLKAIDRNSLELARKSEDELKSIKDKKVRKFYDQQNEKLDDWLEVDAIVTALSDDVLESFNPDPDYDGIPERAGALQNIGEDVEAFLPDDFRQRRQKEVRNAKWAININVIANVILLAAKIGAVFFSSSLSLIASMIDSGLDLLCTLIIWSTNKVVQWRLRSLRAKFPVGRKRLEPLGILVFSIIMVISFIQILQESVAKLLPSGDHRTAELPPIAIGAMVGTIVLKGIIWMGCIPIKTSQVQALAQDCKTDVFFNTLSLLFPFIGVSIHSWQLDPLGALILSLIIIYDWSSTCFSNIIRLSGSAASRRVNQKVLFVAWRFESLVNGFKNITAYHAGDGIWVEVDILMSPTENLMRAHDVAETLQYCLEGLGEVDRAFVTVDYTSHGPTGHSSTLLA